MQEYDIKRGHFKNIEGDGLTTIMKDCFGNAERDGDTYTTKYGAISKLTVIVKSKKVMDIDTQMNTAVDNETAAETIAKYNRFLLEATGFTTKERKKRANKKAKEGKL